MTLTKADLIQKIYKKHDSFTKAQATDAIEAFLHIAKDCLIDGNDLLLSGFGKFNVKDKRERRGRNPRTGEMIMLEPRHVVTFSASGVLKDKVNGR